MYTKDKIISEVTEHLRKYEQDSVEKPFFEVKSKQAKPKKITKQLVSMVNTSNTHSYLVIGVSEPDKGSPIELHEIMADSLINQVNQTMQEVRPRPMYTAVSFKYKSTTLLCFYIFSNDHTLYSFNDKFPYRDYNGTLFLNGEQIKEFYNTGYLPNTHTPQDRSLLSFADSEWKKPVKISTPNSGVATQSIPLKKKLPSSGYKLHKRIHGAEIEQFQDILVRLLDMYPSSEGVASNQTPLSSGVALENNGTFSISQTSHEWIGTGGYRDYFNTLTNYPSYKIEEEDNYKRVVSCFIDQRYIGHNLEMTIIVSASISNKSETIESIEYGDIIILFSDFPVTSQPIEQFMSQVGLQPERWTEYSIDVVESETSFLQNIETSTGEIFVESSEALQFILNNTVLSDIEANKLFGHSSKTVWYRDDLDNPPIKLHINDFIQYDVSSIMPRTELKPYKITVTIDSDSVLNE